MISPDGKVVLYVADGDLYVVPIAGGDSVQITNKIRQSGDMPVFTADGASVVFSRYRSGEDSSRLPDLWIVPSRGGTPRRFIAEASGAVQDATLIETVLPLIPGLIGRLRDGVDVADVGCGSGHAVNLMAEAFPASRLFAQAHTHVSRLAEVCADDVAVRRHSRLDLARALVTVAEGAATGTRALAVALAATGGDAATRVHRLLTPPTPPRRLIRWSVTAASWHT